LRKLGYRLRAASRRQARTRLAALAGQTSTKRCRPYAAQSKGAPDWFRHVAPRLAWRATSY